MGTAALPLLRAAKGKWSECSALASCPHKCVTREPSSTCIYSSALTGGSNNYHVGCSARLDKHLRASNISERSLVHQPLGKS
eukprot:6484138-Amphidinium_carterae.1